MTVARDADSSRNAHFVFNGCTPSVGCCLPESFKVLLYIDSFWVIFSLLRRQVSRFFSGPLVKYTHHRFSKSFVHGNIVFGSCGIYW